MFRIYTDEALQQRLSTDVLWEGVPYYLDLSGVPREERRAFVQATGLGRCFNGFNPRNEVCRFTINGLVGTVEIGGCRFDVRSRKLDMERPGDEQFASLLADIDRIRQGLAFRYGTPNRRLGQEVMNGRPPSALERLDFFRMWMDGPAPGLSIVGTIKRILHNPHHAVRQMQAQEPIETARRLDVPAFARKAGHGPVVEVRPGTAAAGRAVLTSAAGKAFLPRSVPTRRHCLTYDTAENRFLRFFLEEIEAVCLAVQSQRDAPSVARRDAGTLLKQVRELLSEPFFREIGKLQYMPTHSPVLAWHKEYSRIREFYNRSRAGIVTPLDRARHQLRWSSLKNIAELYEIWVFFRLAGAFLGPEGVAAMAADPTSALPQNTSYAAGDIKVWYNKTYAAGAGSYSVELRPDVTVQIGDTLWLFDAKYRADRAAHLDGDDDAEASGAAAMAKVADLHKMHTYVDAIANVQAAFAVYPGTEMNLYPRRRSSDDALEDLCRHGGIGSLPLLPLSGGERLNTVVAAIRAASRQGDRLLVEKA